MIYIISGPSSAGKSTLLQSSKLPEITSLPADYPVVFPANMVNNADALQNGCFFHYNILRVADHLYRKTDIKAESTHHFMADSPWQKMSQLDTPKKAIILLVSRTILKKRMLSRQHVEQSKLTGHSSVGVYPSNHWTEVLDTVNMQELYLAWCAELNKAGISYTLINSEDTGYNVITKDQLQSLYLNK